MQLIGEFTTRGRLGRAGFWWRHLLLLPLLLAAAITLARAPGAPWDLLPAAAATLFLVSVWGRRLHDRGRSAWSLAAVLLPIVGALWLWIECGLRGTRATLPAATPAVPYKAL